MTSDETLMIAHGDPAAGVKFILLRLLFTRCATSRPAPGRPPQCISKSRDTQPATAAVFAGFLVIALLLPEVLSKM